MWYAPIPNPEAIVRMAECRAKWDLTPLVIHDNYLINLAASDPVIRKKSIDAFRLEVLSAIAIGAEYLVMHPGSAKGYTAEEAIATFTDSIVVACQGIGSKHLQILFENTAGQGSLLGSRFEELAELRYRSSPKIDRHANIGEGYIGLEGFRRILTDKQLKNKAFVLETPVDNEGDDLKNVETLKSLCRRRPTNTNRSS